MLVAARPRHIEDHYRTFARRLLADGAPVILIGDWWGIRSALDAIIRSMPARLTHTRPTVVAVWLMIAGAVGWWAAFGWVLQGVVALGAFLVPSLAIVALIFGGMYAYATIKGAALDRRNARLAANPPEEA